jgi:transcriptional regulator with XRE-family HTH domain
MKAPPRLPRAMQPPKKKSEEALRVQKAFGRKLRARRKDLGKSQEGFALACGFDRSFYGQLERGETNPTLQTMLILANALHTTIEELLSGLEE